MLLTYLPLFGFGLYYDKGQCKRYRNAVFLADKVYAYLFLGFGRFCTPQRGGPCIKLKLLGTSISMCIALCNISVIYELRQIGRTHRGLIRHSSKKNLGDRYHTAEEVSFAKLMAVICMIFVICWMPQMVCTTEGYLGNFEVLHIFRYLYRWRNFPRLPLYTRYSREWPTCSCASTSLWTLTYTFCSVISLADELGLMVTML